MACPPQVWDGVLRRLEAEVPAFALEAWLRPLTAEPDGEGFCLLCPTPLHRERVGERFLPLITRFASEEAGRPVAVTVALASTPGRTPSGPAVSEEEAAARRTERPGGTEPGSPVETRRRNPSETRPVQGALAYTFESFVVGPCNALAREASLALAHGSQQGLNPLYLTSAAGLGKTHLSRAIVAESRTCGTERALYASAESFTNDFTASIRSKQMERFKRRFRERCDLLVLEDVQFLGAKAATQLELFHTLTHLLDAGARVVLSGDRLPRRIEKLEPRLCSQMTAGLVAELEAPDAVVRREILRSKAARGGVRLPEDCLELLVEAARGSVRDLEGVLIQLVASSSLLKRPIDLELTEAALRKIAPPRRQARRLEPRAVIEVVAAFFQTPPEALASRSRRRDVLVPRQLAMYLCHRYTDHPLATIAHALGRDHPAVSNAVKVVERRILERPPLRYQVEALCARLDALERELDAR